MMKKSTLSRSLRGARVVRLGKIPRLQSSSEACAPSADFIIDIAELVFGMHQSLKSPCRSVVRWFQFSETREVAGVFIGNNPDHKREGQKGADYQFPVAPGYRSCFFRLRSAN